jgi:adenylate cyclase class 2
MIEIEVKIPVPNIKDIRNKLLDLGAVLEQERSFEENILYDYPSAQLRGKKQAVRLRTIGKKHFLTFKGTPKKSRKFKIREEFETEIKNATHIKKILKSLGLQSFFTYKKFRTRFRIKKLVICLDETEAGNFLELEGKQSDIVHFSKSLGFSKKEFIKNDYIQLILENIDRKKL